MARTLTEWVHRHKARGAKLGPPVPALPGASGLAGPEPDSPEPRGEADVDSIPRRREALLAPMNLTRPTRPHPDRRQRSGVRRALRWGALGLLAPCFGVQWVSPAIGAREPTLMEPGSAPARDSEFSITLPEGPVARAWASVGSGTRPRDLALGRLPRHPKDGAWADPGVWELWSTSVRAEAAADPGESSPARRAQLAILALGLDRTADAWGHYAKTGADPRVAASLLPAFLPGIPPGNLDPDHLGLGGQVLALPEGVLLTPALPPPVGVSSPGRLVRRNMRINGLRIGDAVLDMDVRVEFEGVQIDFHHRSGGAATFRVRAPEPPGFENRVEYVNWFRQDQVRVPHGITVEPGQPEAATLFARVLRRPFRWPTRMPEQLPAAIRLHGLRLSVPEGDPHVEILGTMAAAVGSALDLPCTLEFQPPGVPATPWGGLRIPLPQDPSRAGRLSGLISRSEGWVLP